MVKIKFFKIIILTLLFFAVLKTTPSWAKISVTLVSFKNHPRTMGGVEIEKRLEALIKKQLGEPSQTIEVRLGRRIIEDLFLRINTVFSRFSWVLLLVFLIHLRQLNCSSNKFVFLLVVLRYVLFIILFAFLFFLAV